MLDEWNAVYIMSNGKKVDLTWNELYVLECLIDNKNRTTSSRELTERVYGKGSQYKKHKSIRTFIWRLKKKLEGEIEIISKPTIGFQIKYIGE